VNLLPTQKHRLLLYPDPRLHRAGQPVEEFGPSLQALAERMLQLMREAKGVGLAAPQVGVLLRVFVCNPTGQPGDDLVCVNPELSGLHGSSEQPEACLSLPGVNVTVRRAVRAKLRALDLEGRPFEQEGVELTARIWQHETDHLNGRLITDHMSEADAIANRRVLKQLRDDYAKAHRRARAKAR
jgi:peptide deformylase